MLKLGPLLGLLFCLLTNAAAQAQRVALKPPEGANWRQHAHTYLLVFRERRPFSAAKDSSRCVRMNNYGCLWQRRVPWEGTPGPKGLSGAHDGAGGAKRGHAIFDHPKWSIVASMKWFETKHRQSPNLSATDLASYYAPWCDTIGSRATKFDRSGQSWGRSCSDAPRPAASFKGSMCRRPANGQPSKAQCQACNCPNSIATYWLADTDLDPSQPLKLFDEQGLPNSTLRSLITQKIALETGKFKPTKELMNEAARAFVPTPRKR